MYLRIIHVYIIYNMSTYMYVSGTHVYILYTVFMYVAIIMTHDVHSQQSVHVVQFL